jgi:hypothetical protein
MHNINDASNQFSNVVCITSAIHKQNNKKYSNKNPKQINLKENKKKIQENSYENILNKILESKENSEIIHQKSQNNLRTDKINISKHKKEISTDNYQRRKSETGNLPFYNDKNLKIPQRSAFYANGQLKNQFCNNNNNQDLFSEVSQPGSLLSLKNKNSFKNSLINNNKCINIKIFKKVEMEKVMNFELLSDIERFNNHPLKNNPFLYVTNQIVNINKKNINNINDYDYIKKNSEMIQTEPWVLENMSDMKFTINNNVKKKNFLCCF